MNKAEQVFEKLAINASPMMRLAVRFKKMYGLSTGEAVNMAKKTELAIKPTGIKKFFGAKTNNRLDILQNELKDASRPFGRSLDKKRFPVKKVYENDKLIEKSRSFSKPKRYTG